MLECEQELAKLGVPIKTRHNEVAPAQYEVAPIFENSNVGVDHQQLDDAGAAERRPPLRPRLPAAREAVRGRQRLGQAQQLVDGHRHRATNLLEPGDTPHENLPFLFFCTAVISGGQQAPGAAARVASPSPGQDHRLGANEAPPAIISVFLGAELEKVFDAIETGSGDAATPQAYLGLGASVLPRLPQARRRPQPHLAVRVHRQQVRVPRAPARRSRSACPNTVLNTIVAEAIDAPDGRRARTKIDGGASVEEAVLAVVKDAWTANKPIVFDGDGYSDEWHAEAESRGLLEPALDARTRCRR